MSQLDVYTHREESYSTRYGIDSVDIPTSISHRATPQSDTSVIIQQVHNHARAAQIASRGLRVLPTDRKNQVLVAASDALLNNSDIVLAANDEDMLCASDMQDHLKDRLRLDKPRLEAIAADIRKIASLADPIGEVIRGYTLPNGLTLEQIRVPLGVIGMVYEARPNVTADAFAIAFKASSAVLLRGSHTAAQTNTALVTIFRDVLRNQGLPSDVVNLLPSDDRTSVLAMIQARGLVDIVIPRGGAELINTVVTNATVPTIETGVGNCHIYIHRDADLTQALKIVLNAKTRRPAVCNSVETVLIDQILSSWLPEFLQTMHDAGISVHGEESGMIPVTEDDWSREYLSLDLAVKLVPDHYAAIEHITRYGTSHTEAIITENYSVARLFCTQVDAAAVMVNASTAFTDGGQFGFGSEIGISTQKLHARGPMGLTELTTTKWQVWGDGHIRT